MENILKYYKFIQKFLNRIKFYKYILKCYNFIVLEIGLYFYWPYVMKMGG